MNREATARIKINRLLEERGWRFFDDGNGPANIQFARSHYFKAYATSDQLRHVIASGHLTDLATNPVFSTRDLRAVPLRYRTLVPEYIKDYVSLNQFVA
jgi:type I restriction enzyme, R subunit